MSVLVRRAIEDNLQVVRDQIADLDSNTTSSIAEQIKELEASKHGIKNKTAQNAIQKEIDSLSKKLAQKPKDKPYKGYKAELKSLEDGYTKVLAVMSNLEWYQTSTRGRKAGTKVAKKAK